MMPILPALALLAVVPGVAEAAALHVRWTSPWGESPVSFTFDDVKPGPLPGMLATGPEGTEYLIHLVLERPEASDGGVPKVLIDARIRELKADRKGRAYLRTLSAPRLVTDVGVPASLFQGGRAPVPGTDPVEWRDVGMTLEVTCTDETSQAATAAAAPSVH
jgi:hypothetical protein